MRTALKSSLLALPLVFGALVLGACGSSDENPEVDAQVSTAIDASSSIDASPVCMQAPRVGCGSTDGVTITRYTDRAAFEAALPNLCVQVVDFDDVDTSAATPVMIAADRYASSHGVVITGTDGQYVDEAFSIAEDFIPTSAPNQYAPGPPAFGVQQGTAGTGGHETDVTFIDGAAAGCVAGFGAVFIDADFPGLGPSSLAVFSSSDALLDLDSPIEGADASQLFRGMIATDGSGNPVPVIGRVHLVNGNEWPERDIDEGVTLDDFLFDQPDAP